MEKITIPNEIGKMQREPLVRELSELRQQMTAHERQISEGDAKLAEAGLTEAQIKTQIEIVRFMRGEIADLQDRALILEDELAAIGSVLGKPIDEQADGSAWSGQRYQNGSADRRGAQ